MRKKIAAILISALAISTLTACQEYPAFQDPAVKEEYTEDNLPENNSPEKEDFKSESQDFSSEWVQKEYDEITSSEEYKQAKKEFDEEYPELEKDLPVYETDGVKGGFGDFDLFSLNINEAMLDDAVINYEYSYEDPYFNTEEYNEVTESGFKKVSLEPLSTFAADVDTGSYCNLRDLVSLRSGSVFYNGVRTEEVLNYFDYNIENKSTGKFSVKTEIDTCPWDKNHDLMLLVAEANPVVTENKGNNFIFLIDVSGSMAESDRISLAVKGFNMLTSTLNENDKVSIVTYSGSEQTLLEGSSDKKEIYKALMKAEFYCYGFGGGTNGSGGIEAAYKCGLDNYIKGGNNRVIIASDGDMNLGITSQNGLVELIEEKKESGIFLTTLGFGRGNYSDANMERIADCGNGNYYYIDCLDEARRVLKEKVTETTVTVAKDVKFQVEFNPNLVSEYRLIGYENRTMAASDFNDDSKDGGEVGAKQQVAILYELIPAVASDDSKQLKYQTQVSSENNSELLNVAVRYKEPADNSSKLEEFPVLAENRKTTDDWRLAVCIAETCAIINDSQYIKDISFKDLLELSKDTGNDYYRQQFSVIIKDIIDMYDERINTGEY